MTVQTERSSRLRPGRVAIYIIMIAFALFYLLRIWDQERSPALLVPIGLLAGFAFAMKYTAVLATPYAIGFVGWKLLRKRERLLRPLATMAVCALVMIVPWLVKNWIVVQRHSAFKA